MQKNGMALLGSIRVSTRTGKMGRHFPVREKSGNFWTLEKPGKSHKILENSGYFRKRLFAFLVIFKWTVYYLLKWRKFSVKKQNIKKYWKNGNKYWKSQGILSVWKSGNHVDFFRLLDKYLSFTNTQNWALEAFLCETHCRNINKFCLLRGDQKILRMALILTDSPAAMSTVRNLWISEPSEGIVERFQRSSALPNIKYNFVVLFLRQMY